MNGRGRKRLALAALCLALLLAAGCAAKTQDALTFCFGTERFDAAVVETVVYQHAGETQEPPVTVTDPVQLRALVAAAAQLEVGAAAEQRATDSDSYLTFYFDDGTTCTLAFEGRNLVRDGRAYLLTNDATLWKLTASLAAENGTMEERP